MSWSSLRSNSCGLERPAGHTAGIKIYKKKQDLSEVKEKCKLKNLAIHEWIAKHPQTEKQNKTKTFQGKTFSGRKNSNKGIDDNKLHPRNTTPLTTTRLDLTCSRDIESDAQQRLWVFKTGWNVLLMVILYEDIIVIQCYQGETPYSMPHNCI